MKKLEDYVISVPDFPKPGILFRDVTGVLRSGEGFRMAVDAYCALLKDVEFDLIVGLESRGFLFASPVADRLGKGLILARKAGKLPRKTKSIEYGLEYGTDVLEIHEDDVRPGQRVVIVDDLMATGGTALATAGLVKLLGGEVVKIISLIELVDLGGRDKLSGYTVESVLKFPGH